MKTLRSVKTLCLGPQVGVPDAVPRIKEMEKHEVNGSGNAEEDQAQAMPTGMKTVWCERTEPALQGPKISSR